MMDSMSLMDLMIVGIPEVLLIIFIIFAIYDFNLLKQIKQKKNILKMVTSIIIVLTINYLSRKIFSNFMMIGLCTTIIYMIVFKGIWKFKFYYSLLLGLLSCFILWSSEILTYPVVNKIIDDRLIISQLINNRIVLSIPSRIFQIIILFILIKINIKIINIELFNTEYRNLSLSQLISRILIIIMIILCLIFLINYIEIFMKITFNDLKMFFIKDDMKIRYILVICFVLISVMIFKRTISYEIDKQILNSPKLILEKIIQNSDKYELEYYIRLFGSYLNVITLEDIEQIFSQILNVECNIDPTIALTVCDYKYLLKLFDNIVKTLRTKIETRFLKFIMKKNSNNINIVMTFYFNDFQKIKFKKYVDKNKCFNECKTKLVLENDALINIDFNKSIVKLTIIIPIKEVIFNENKN